MTDYWVSRFSRSASFIFIAPPSRSELARRLEDRNTDSAVEIAARLEVSKRELAAMGEFDHTVVNDDLDAATNALTKVVAQEIGIRPVEH